MTKLSKNMSGPDIGREGVLHDNVEGGCMRHVKRSHMSLWDGAVGRCQEVLHELVRRNCMTDIETGCMSGGSYGRDVYCLGEV